MFSLRRHKSFDPTPAKTSAKRRPNFAPWWVFIFLATLLLMLLLGDCGFAERPFPKRLGLVNDYAEVIPERYEAKIQAVVNELIQKTEIPIVLVTMPDIGGAEYNDYVNRLYSAWGIGKRGQDKGVLVFLTVKERKMRIETGYGVEAILPDGLVGEIRDRYMIPYFKKNEFGEGMLNGTLAIAQVIAKDSGIRLTGGELAPKAVPKGKSGISFFPMVLLLLFFILAFRRRGLRSFLLGALLMGGRGSAGRGYGGGGVGGSFGGFGGGFGGFGGGMSGGGGAGGSF